MTNEETHGQSISHSPKGKKRQRIKLFKEGTSTMTCTKHVLENILLQILL
jgi:hypothetical protein